MAAKFEIKASSDGQFMFNLKAANGEIILTSERYTTKASCENGIASVKTNAPDDARFDRLVATDGQFYFTLKAANHQVIGRSERYVATAGRDNGIESVKRNAPEAAIVDTTAA